MKRRIKKDKYHKRCIHSEECQCILQIFKKIKLQKFEQKIKKLLRIAIMEPQLATELLCIPWVMSKPTKRRTKRGEMGRRTHAVYDQQTGSTAQARASYA